MAAALGSEDAGFDGLGAPSGVALGAGAGAGSAGSSMATRGDDTMGLGADVPMSLENAVAFALRRNCVHRGVGVGDRDAVGSDSGSGGGSGGGDAGGTGAATPVPAVAPPAPPAIAAFADAVASSLRNFDADAALAALRNPETSLAHKTEGNKHFVASRFLEAAECYSSALETAPLDDAFRDHRGVFFANRAACFLKLGRFEEAVEDCHDALAEKPEYVKALYRRATAFEKLDKLDEALKDVEEVVRIDPTAREAAADAARLKRAVDERNEKLKDEMMGKLKDLGNTVLGKFGLSLDNFKMDKDPNTGSMNISFQK